MARDTADCGVLCCCESQLCSDDVNHCDVVIAVWWCRRVCPAWTDCCFVMFVYSACGYDVVYAVVVFWMRVVIVAGFVV